MIYYETYLIVYILLAIAPFALGFIFKTKSLRYFSWFIGLLFLFITISIITSHTTSVAQKAIKFPGLYELDLQKSIYKKGDLTKYQTLTLTVKPDDTFLFSDTSFFLSQKGKWEFEDNEDGGFVNCILPNKNYKSLVFAGHNLWGFQQDCIRNGSNGDIIYFKKQLIK